MKNTTFVITAILLLVSLSFAEEPVQEVSAAGKYPLNVCPISGETLGEMGDPVVKVYDGREVKFCCGNCVAPFEKDMKASFRKLDKQIMDSQKANYPLDKCVVSGESLGEMGSPFEHMYKNRLVLLCCEGCVKEFDRHPDKFLSMLDEASAKESSKEEKHE
jgi:YHS domain-containing protein